MKNKITYNYSEIQDKYPLSFKLYVKYVSDTFGEDNWIAGYPIKFFDSQGLYITVLPEFYKEGINWNLQIFWYSDKSKWPKHPTKHIEDYIIEGTMLYGDNNEFPTRSDCEEAGCVFAFELLERKLTGKKILPDDFVTQIVNQINKDEIDELNFNKLFYKINHDNEFEEKES